MSGRLPLLSKVPALCESLGEGTMIPLFTGTRKCFHFLWLAMSCGYIATLFCGIVVLLLSLRDYSLCFSFVLLDGKPRTENASHGQYCLLTHKGLHRAGGIALAA